MVSNGVVHCERRASTIAKAVERAPAGLNGKTIDKVERYKWTIADEKGMFEWIDKNKLLIDEEYQRSKVSEARINEIASCWSWIACNSILVGLRENGSMWVIDGQHRVLGARKRSDITLLPCMIFDATQVTEASGFLKVNTNRKPLTMLERLNAMVIEKDPVALRIVQVVAESGYRLIAGGTTRTVACASALVDIFRKNDALAYKIWNLTVTICHEHKIPQDLLMGLFELESRLASGEHGTSLFERHNVETLDSVGIKRLLESIATSASYHGARTAKSCAIGITNAINKKRSTRRIPDVFK
jgi:hypothetical protein